MLFVTITKKITDFQDIFLPSPFEGEGCYDGDDYASLSDCKRLCYSNYITTRCQCHKFSPSGTAEGKFSMYTSCTLVVYPRESFIFLM